MTSTDSFVPLMTATVSSGDPGMFQLKVLPQAEAKTIFEPLPATGAPAPQPTLACGHPPSVTVQRQGEVVSGIRIECGCGQVIELACAY